MYQRFQSCISIDTAIFLFTHKHRHGPIFLSSASVSVSLSHSTCLPIGSDFFSPSRALCAPPPPPHTHTHTLSGFFFVCVFLFLFCFVLLFDSIVSPYPLSFCFSPRFQQLAESFYISGCVFSFFFLNPQKTVRVGLTLRLFDVITVLFNIVQKAINVPFCNTNVKIHLLVEKTTSAVLNVTGHEPSIC